MVRGCFQTPTLNALELSIIKFYWVKSTKSELTQLSVVLKFPFIFIETSELWGMLQQG